MIQRNAVQLSACIYTTQLTVSHLFRTILHNNVLSTPVNGADRTEDADPGLSLQIYSDRCHSVPWRFPDDCLLRNTHHCGSKIWRVTASVSYNSLAPSSSVTEVAGAHKNHKFYLKLLVKGISLHFRQSSPSVTLAGIHIATFYLVPVGYLITSVLGIVDMIIGSKIRQSGHSVITIIVSS